MPRTVKFRAAVLTVFLAILSASTARAADDCMPKLPGWDAPGLQMGVKEEDGAEMLFIEGRIGPDLPLRLKTVIAEHPDIAVIHFNASGDDRASAMAAGLVLRAAGNFEAHVPAGATCTDACALLYLSGRIRSVDPAAVFDLGQFYTPGQRSAKNADVARQSLEVSNYLIRMGVSRRLLTGTLDRDAASAVPAGRRCLTPEELHGYNVANWNE